MHDLFEGVVPHHPELILNVFIGERYVTLENINVFFASMKLQFGIERMGFINTNLKIKGRFGSGQILTFFSILTKYCWFIIASRT